MIPLLLFGVCLVHRLLQLTLLWPGLIEHPLRADHVMQLLPAAIWREHFAAAALYLQQAPPLPNFIFGAFAWLFAQDWQLTLALLCLQILLACCSIALFSSLLLRFGLPNWVCLLAPVILFFGGDIVVMEYNVMGQFFYEQGTMLLCLLACHSALSYQRSGSLRALLLLGLWVALLALNRSTFSYFALPVLLWVIAFTRQNRLAAIIVFLVPVLLLHGGWSLKNKLVYGYSSIATSSWGGANARTGDVRRSGGEQVVQWMQQQPPLCEPQWWHMVSQYRRPIFFFPDKAAINAFAQPRSVLESNQRMATARGQQVFFDTETIRLYSACWQRIYMRYWLQHPLVTLEGAWRSYQIFWLPIREFVARNPIPIAPQEIQDSNVPAPDLWLRQALRELYDNHYYAVHMDLELLPKPFAYKKTRLWVLPFAPLVLESAFFLVIHVAGLYFLFALVYPPLRRRWPEWMSLVFPLLCIAYVAGLTSLVEFGENMRFRLEVVPLIWAVCLVALRGIGLWLGQRVAPMGKHGGESLAPP